MTGISRPCHALTCPAGQQRAWLLMAVMGLHVGLISVLMNKKTIDPQPAENLLIVDLFQMPTPEKPPLTKSFSSIRPKAAQPPAASNTTPQTPLSPQSESPAPAISSASPAKTLPAPATPISETVTQARFDGDYLNNPAPPYPALSRRMGEEGKVVLRVSVNPQGTAESVEIRTSSGSQRLDDAAQKTVRHWKFIPARRGDSPVQSWVLVPIIFKLEQ